MEILNYPDLLFKAEDINLQDIVAGKLKIVGRGWTKVNIDPVLMEQIAKDATKVLGGRHSTKKTIIDHITGKDASSLYHQNLKDVVLKSGENRNPLWKFSPRTDFKEAKQSIRDYFNRL